MIPYSIHVLVLSSVWTALMTLLNGFIFLDLEMDEELHGTVGARLLDVFGIWDRNSRKGGKLEKPDRKEQGADVPKSIAAHHQVGCCGVVVSMRRCGLSPRLRLDLGSIPSSANPFFSPNRALCMHHFNNVLAISVLFLTLCDNGRG